MSEGATWPNFGSARPVAPSPLRQVAPSPRRPVPSPCNSSLAALDTRVPATTLCPMTIQPELSISARRRRWARWALVFLGLTCYGLFSAHQTYLYMKLSNAEADYG